MLSCSHRKKEYFLEHSILEIYLQNLFNELVHFGDVKFVHGVMAIIQRWKNLYHESGHYINEIMAQVAF